MSSLNSSKLDQERNLEIATTILNQLGYHRFLIMTGARNLAAIPNGLRFSIPGSMTRKRINLVEIVLTPADLYRVTFLRSWKSGLKEVASFDDVFWEDLEAVFSRTTGLATRL